MPFDKAKYGELLSDTLPGVIESQKEYDRLEAIFNKLITRGEANLSPEESRLFALLANLLEDYEARTLPKLAKTKPVDALKFLMAQNHLVQADLVDVFGDQSTVSKVLRGVRPIGTKAALRLSERFKVSTDLFLKEA